MSKTLGTISIARRFCGPPESGNGGYVAGILGNFFDGASEVTLRVPPPLESAMDVRADGEGQIAMTLDEEVIATARPAEFTLDVPQAPDFEGAELANKNFGGFDDHGLPGCFVCGPHRAAGDGLRLFAGPTQTDGVLASHWIPDESLANDDGAINPEFVWAALDCPGGFAVTPVAGSCLLGRMALKTFAPVNAGEQCVVTGWPIGTEGRKRYAGTALFGEDGQLRAVARATWIELKTAEAN